MIFCLLLIEMLYELKNLEKQPYRKKELLMQQFKKKDSLSFAK